MTTPPSRAILTVLSHIVHSKHRKEADKPPSVRSLASSLAINPNTIQRAYEALEREGYVYTIAGRGTFAAPQKDVGEERKKQLLAAFDETARELIYLGVTAEELRERLGKQET